MSPEPHVSDVLDRLKAALADRYAVQRELGSGGMATVYKALGCDPGYLIVKSGK